MSCQIPGPTPAPADIPPVVDSSAPRPAALTNPTLADLTTMRVGGPIGQYVEAQTEQELIDAVVTADDAGVPLLIVGGGSNLVGADEGFPGTVVRDMRRDLTRLELDGCGGALVRAAGGHPWDAFVHHTISEGWMGVEALSGIPGSVGAAPVQNVGAYGQEVAGTISSLTVWDRLTRQRRQLALSELEFGYRTSLLKRTLSDPTAGGGRTWGPTGRYVVLDVTFQFRLASLSEPVRYQELARRLGVKLHDRAPATELRAAVLELRRSKGMVLDPTNHDTWSTGSFFTNPVISDDAATRLPADAPRFPVTDATKISNIGQEPPVVPGLVKTSAAWLIGQAGFQPGYKLGGAALSSKHTLAITNRGSATGADVRALAARITAGVQDTFGVALVPEPILL